MTQKVWSCNEWDPLKEIIIGTSIGANIPINSIEPILELKTKDAWPIIATKTQEIR